jgi:hypothetical protein
MSFPKRMPIREDREQARTWRPRKIAKLTINVPVVLFGVRRKDFDAGKSITRAIRRGRP